MKLNEDRLVMLSAEGEVTPPLVARGIYSITHKGEPVVLPGVGGITYNIRVGAPAMGWEADHAEPGVSISNLSKREIYRDTANACLNTLACIGNEARVVSGDAKGAKGVVTGKHGGIEHVLVDFSPAALEKLTIGDRILVKTFGTGLRFLDFPAVKIFNTSPALVRSLNPRLKNGKLEVPVTHILPAAIMGSGLGSIPPQRGDYDIQLFDESIVKKYSLHTLRLGDIVAIQDADHSYGRLYQTGAMSVGAVIHSDCVHAGHGPGVVTIFTSAEGRIEPRLDPRANLLHLLKLGKSPGRK
jgi:hypothetical protein